MSSVCSILEKCLHQTLGGLQAKLNGKVHHGGAAGEIDPAKEVICHPLFAPGNKPCHDKAPEGCASQKASEEDSKMNRLRPACDGCKDGRAETRPKNDVERIAEGEKCAAGKISMRRCGLGSAQAIAVAGIFESIPCEFEHEQNADQTQGGFGDGVLNEEGKTCQRDDGPGRVTHERAELNIQGWDKSTGRTAANRLSGDDARRSAEGDRENE